MALTNKEHFLIHFWLANGTLNIIFSVSYYLKLHNAISQPSKDVDVL